MGMFRAGILSPLPVRVFTAEQVVDAFRYMQQARQIGKVVVSFDGANIVPQSLSTKHVQTRFNRDAAYLVTGGVSGFGLETARWLASHGAGQVILLSRRGVDTPGVEEAVNSIQALGAKAEVLAVDVTDRAALEKALQQKGLLPIKGFFHAAMVIDDALMANLDPERMTLVLQPKIKGAWNLHELSKKISLDHFMLYSSVTTYIGNPGQANYVAGNAWLEGLAVLRRAQGLPVTCIGWGPIGDAGYLTRNQAVKDSLASRLGAEPLTADAALQMLGRALATTQPNLAIADFQWSALARLLPSAQGTRFVSLPRHGDEAAGGAENLGDFRALIEGKSPAEVQALVAQLVTQEVSQILAVSAERIDPARSLHDLGLDSLMGVELALGLEKRFGIQVPAMMLNEGPTVERVTARIIERLATGEISGEEVSDLTATAISMAAQHGGSVSREVLETAVAEIEQKAEC
jgi:acyl carrier protein